MKRILAMILVLTMTFSMMACSLDDFVSTTSSSKGEQGGEAKTVTVYFKVGEKGGTLIGPNSLTVKSGEELDWTSVPVASLIGCEFVGWAYDVNGERMLDLAEDKFFSDTELYAIFKKASDDGFGNDEPDNGNSGSTDDTKPSEDTTDSIVSGGNDGEVDTSVGDSDVDIKPEDSDVDTSIGDSSVDIKPEDSNVDTKPEDSDVDTKPEDSNVDTKPEESTINSGEGGGNIDKPDLDIVIIHYEAGRFATLEDDEWEIELKRGDRFTAHPIPTWDGYTFTGWYVDEECTTPVTNGKRYTDDVTYLYAGWELIETFTVKFYSFGSYIEKTQVVKGGTVIPLEVEYTEGYIFKGWSYEGEVWDFAKDVVTCDMVLEAKYDLQKYSITYENLNGAANSNKTSYTVEDAFTLNDLSLDGYTFEGWYLDDALEQEVTTIYYGTTGDIVLYAGWEKIVVVPTPPSEEEAPTVLETWSGKTLNILATTWGDTVPSAPWSQPELTVGPNDWNSTAGFGSLINSAILTRAEEIENTYGVTLNWINARGNHIATLLSEAIVAGSESTKYHIAMPRMLEAQDIVATNSIYDLANREYIDLTKSYYNQASVESYSVQGRTLFAGGDFSFLDEETTYVQYLNAAMLEGMQDRPDLYQLVRDGKWTIDQMINVAKLVSKNSAEPKWTDDDIYGYGTTNLSRFYQYSGIKQVSVGETEYGIEYVITLNDPKISTLIDKILTIKSADWARTEWTGGYGATQQAFEEGRLLFYDEVLQRADYFVNQNDDFKVGILPEPKLSESQASYHTPCAYQSTVMCVPKATPDREMSDYFVEILAYTGQKHIMKAYMQQVRENLGVNNVEENMEMLEEYIFPGMIYDQGWMYGWNGLLNVVQSESYSSGKPNFTASYEYAIEQAYEIVSKWNLAWYNYTDKVK